MRRLWGDDVLAALDALLGEGLTYEQCAAKLNGTMGLGRVTRHHVAGAVYRQRSGDTPAPATPAPTEPPPPAPPAPGKHPMVCRYGDCRLTRQPGRDYCAEHHRTLVAERMPREHGESAP